MAKRKDTLQVLCRGYLVRLRYMARKHGIDVDGLIHANKSGECEATMKEVEMLSRLVDDERVARRDIPEIVSKTYRQCCDDDIFGKIKTLKRVGIYSKVSALLHKCRKEDKTKGFLT